MRQTIRALGWTIKILWIITLGLPVTVSFSLMEFLDSKAIGFQEFTPSFSEGQFYFSAPFYINNTGFYDLSEINITVFAEAENRTVARFSQIFPKVPAHSLFNASYRIAFSLEEIVSKNSNLLFHDLDVDLGISLFFRVAYVISFEIALNLTMPWGAPFYNFSLTSIQYNSTSQEFSTLVTFENHAQFPINGTLLIAIFNEENDFLGSYSEFINVYSEDMFQKMFEIPVEDLKMGETGFIRIFFDDIKIFEEEWSLSG